MFIPERLIGTCAKRIIKPGIDTIEIDWNRFFYNILFSDHYILDSILLREIPFLIKKFGYSETRTLLLSKVISLRCEVYNMGLLDLENPSHEFLYQIHSFDIVDRTRYLQNCFDDPAFKDEILQYLTKKERLELIEIVQNKLLNPPIKPFKTIWDSFSNELEKNLSLKELIQIKLLSVTHINISPARFEIKVERIDSNKYLVRNNIEERYGINQKIVHKAIGNSILSLGRQHIHLFKMEFDKAIACYREDEKPIIVNNLEFLTRQLNPTTHMKEFQRVIKLAELPQLDIKSDFKITQLLKIRDTHNWIQFKQWLNCVSDLSDEEIQRELQHKVSRVLSFLGGSGKNIGHIINISSAFLDLNPAISLTIGYFPWLLNKLLSPKGYILFLYRDYQSIFE